jgi:peptidoglycan/LPS O-acetylase OafA/YrhL
MWFAWKRRFNFFVVTLVIALASFAWSVGTVRSDAIAAFYSPLSRFWELLIGAILAYITLHRPDIGLKYGKPCANWWSILGFALIAVNVVILGEQKAFPGWWALLPTLGTASVIFASSRAWLNRNFLSHPVLVWFGLISYPLYLWHWPLLSLARIVHGPLLSRGLRLVLVFVSIALA